MSVKLFVCYEVHLPDKVADDMEQELYDSTMGEEGGEANIAMFISPKHYPSLRKYMDEYGMHDEIKLYVEAKISA